MDFETIEVSHSCSAITSSNIVVKKDDLGAFTIPCTIGFYQFSKALYDLGASIKLMPYAIFKYLDLGEPKTRTMQLLMEDRSIKRPIVILYDILVKIVKFIFIFNFFILDYEIDVEVPTILGRPFLATKRALVDVESGKLKFCVNSEEATFNVCKSMKQPNDLYVISLIDVIDETVASVQEVSSVGESLADVLLNFDGDDILDYDEVVAALLGIGSYPKPSINDPPKLELKVLPSHLKYVLLGTNDTLPVIIAADLLNEQVKALVRVLKKFINAIGWIIADIVGIPLGVCTHKI
ncbi:uncharacterized protein LOC129892868 [Solanum dulcamara]|uniref:uncharacterized protein LOC129892868 n=1 Tax=Solanum dulcamara TaxID=45834 RepID=UPI002486C509|nr:uncharacterized protein LOC129892868 [Solanum dulcamara]